MNLRVSVSLCEIWIHYVPSTTTNVTTYPLLSCGTNITRYVWGLDLSGTPQGAGGVGGLCAVFPDNGITPHYPAYNANGNITEYVDFIGNTVAHYEYDAFGNITGQSGSMADDFVFRFSTKYFDTETGLCYYGRIRYYKPSFGRFISRDPIEEQGGLNLYGFCGNDPINSYDYLGMWKIERNGNEAWATAIAEDGDTFCTLANKIKLNCSERTKWLKKSSGGFVSKSDIAKTGCKYKIPNVFVVYTSKSGIGDGIIMFVTELKRVAKADAAKYKAKNYKVVETLRTASDDVFSDLWSTDGIFAFSFAGHGTKYGFKADKNSDDAVAPSAVSIPYKLQAVRAYSCLSAAEIPTGVVESDGTVVTSNWRKLVSRRGTFYGYIGNVHWINQFWQVRSINATEIPD